MLNPFLSKSKTTFSPASYTEIISSSLPKRPDFYDDDSENKILTVLGPARTLNEILFTEKTYPLEFNWATDDGKKITIEVYDSIEQDKPYKKFTFTNSGNKSVELPEGLYWWKISCEDETVTGKVKILCSEKPELAAPAKDFVFSYKSKEPNIRFTWKESKGAVSYKLKIADNPDMKSPVVDRNTSATSVIVPNMKKGIWYWQIIPSYEDGIDDLLNASEIGSFEIIQKENLDKPEIHTPSSNETVVSVVKNKGKSVYKPIYFSWKNDEEATGYEYKVWKEGSESNPVVTGTTTSNFFIINPETTPLAPGVYYWRVSNIDEDGVKISSEDLMFYVTEEEFNQVTVFPTDNYTLMTTLSRDTYFTWKSNLQCETTIQISTDPEFTDIVFTDKTTASSMDGIQLGAGTYYWRTSAVIAEIPLVTPAKVLNVVNQMDAAVLRLPQNGKKEVVTPGIPVQFQWNTIEGADYYKFTLFTTKNPDRIVFEKNYITSYNGKDITLRLNMDYMAETNYTWTIQGFKDESENSSRITSKLASSNFRMRIWKPVKLLWPLNDTEYGGIEAFTNPDNFVWSSIDAPASSKIVLYKSTTDSNYGAITNPKGTQRMPRFNEGEYFWTVVARTYDNIDISATEMRKFSVKEMPKLPMPGMIAPAKNSLIDIDYLINYGAKMNFKWKPMEGITRYIFRLFKKEDPSPLFEIKIGPDKSEYTLEGDLFLNTLGKYNGGWYWSIEAQLDYQGELMQRGLTEMSAISVNIPRNKPGDVQTLVETDLRYGTNEEFDENVEKKLKNAKRVTTPKTKKTKKSQKDPIQSSKKIKNSKDDDSEA